MACPEWPSSGIPTWESRRSSIASPSTREAVVASEAGVTRDRKEGAGRVDRPAVRSWWTRAASICRYRSPLSEQVRAQARWPSRKLPWWSSSWTASRASARQEHEIAEILRHGRCRSCLAVNKIEPALRLPDCTSSGNSDWGSRSASRPNTGLGTGDLLDAVVEPSHAEATTEEGGREGPMARGDRGSTERGQEFAHERPVGDERVIVSPIPGTTRDSIDTGSVYEGSRA